nr:LOW QUALITY PROTEIN: uncharacterized protein C2orf78 homolog [Pelodiscus sinensis]|eukprot:XP_025043547.1 LOW QUALITY PROTEIN: uncharacterized protein C2orf78 homolog [Pelodiscus sinensis]
MKRNENCHAALVSEDLDPDHLSFPKVIDSPSMGESLHNFPRPPVPASGSAWLVSSGSSQPVQANPGNTNALAYQPPETGLWPDVRGAGAQIQLSSSAAPYPAIYGWGMKGHSYGTAAISARFPVTLLAQEVTNPAPSAPPQFNHASRVSPVAHLYGRVQPPANARFMQIQAPPPSVQGHQSQGAGQQVSLQDWRGTYLYNRDLRGQGSGETGSIVQRGRVIKVPTNTPSEMVLVLKAIQPMGTRPSSSASLYYPVSAQSRDSQATEPGFKEADALPGTQLEPRTFCLQPGPAQQGGGVKTASPEMLLEALDGSQMCQGSQGPPLFPLEIPDINQLMASIDPVQAAHSLSHSDRPAGLRQMAGGNYLLEMPLGKHAASPPLPTGSSRLAPGKGQSPRNAPKPTEPVALPAPVPSGGSDRLAAGSGPGFPDPQKLGGDRSEMPTALEPARLPDKDQAMGANGFGDAKDLTPQMETASGDHLPDDPWEGNLENRPASGTRSITAIGDGLESPCPDLKPRTAELRRQPLRKSANQADACQPDEQPHKRLSGAGNDKGRSTNQSRGKLKPEDKQLGSQEGGKIFPPEREPFKMPRSHLGLHMLESIQVFHPLGKKLIPLGPARGVPTLHPIKVEGNSSGAWPKPFLCLKRPLGPPEDPNSICGDRQDGQRDDPGKLCPAPGNTRPVALATPRHVAVKHSPSPAPPAKPPFGTDPSLPHECSPLLFLSSAWRGTQPPPALLKKVSLPIPPEQRGKREAMKRRAQRERELAAQYTTLGKRQFFVERERDLTIAEEFGYV